MNKEKRDYYYNLYKKELFDYCAPFWIKYGDDKEFGGLQNCLDKYGEVYSTDKSVWLQGRCGYMYSYLSNTFGRNEEYLRFAKSSIDFLNKYCFDKDGRMYFTVTRDGRPLRKRRYAYSETFYIIASIEYYGATKEKKYLDDARKVYDMTRLILMGISDPFQIFPKVYPETRSTKSIANPMILLNVSSAIKKHDAERKDLYNETIDWCISEIKKHHNEEYHGIIQEIGSNDEFILDVSSTRIVNPGHDLECSFFLAQVAKERGDKELLSLAETVFREAIERGWDEEYEGIKYFVDILGKPVEAYEHDMKLWWPHNEAINASLTLYYLTNDEYYLNWFEKITKYAFDHFSEHEYGEWYGYLRRDGKPTEPACKGHTYKGPFHVMRSLATVLTLLNEYEK